MFTVSLSKATGEVFSGLVDVVRVCMGISIGRGEGDVDVEDNEGDGDVEGEDP